MHSLLRVTRLLSIIILVFGLSLAACSPQPEAAEEPETAEESPPTVEEEPDQPTEEAAEPEVETPDEQPEEEDEADTAADEPADAATSTGEETVLRIATPYVVSTLDPIKSAAAGDIEVLGQLYSRLLRMNSDTGELEPGLAEDWEMSDDETVWTFHLRDAQFSDGSPITAEDVVFSFLRLRDQEDSAYPGAFQVIKEVEALDEKTVRFTLNGPSAPFLGTMEMFNAGIVPKAYVEEVGDEEFASNPVVSGPYQVREWLPNDRLILERNPHYWREGYPKLDVVEVIEVPDENTRVSMLQAREADFVRDIPWASVDQLDSQPDIVVPLNPSSVINVVLLNHEKPPLDDVRVAKAMAMAVDVPGLVQAVTFGHGTPANSPLPNTLIYYHEELEPYPYDPEQAKALIEEAGATGAEIEFLSTAGAGGDQASVLIQDQLSAVGLNPTITQVDVGTWWDRVVSGDYGAAVTWWYNETTDPDMAVRWALCGACGNQSFYTRYDNERINELTDLAVTETDTEERREMYYEIQEIALEEVSQIPLYYQPYRNAYRANVQGLMMTPALQWTLEQATLSE